MIPSKFSTAIKTMTTLRGWPQYACNKSKMVDGRHTGKINKSQYLSNGLNDIDEIWHDDAYWIIGSYPISLKTKLRASENPRWGMAVTRSSL